MVLRFGIIYLFVAIGFVLVVRKVLQIQHSEKENWMALSDSLRKVDREQDLDPDRGNIYSDEGELMASTVPSYYIYMDFKTPALRDKGGELFKDNLDSLAICLSRKFEDKSKSEYRKYLMKGYQSKNRHYRITKKKLSHADYKEILKFPLFRIGSRSGLIAEAQIKRIKPYGSLAARTIGDLFGEKGKGAQYGLEAAFDKYLTGKSGIGHLERKAGANILIPDTAPENGADIISTINVDMQDIAEKALREKLAALKAEKGCVVLMEVKTGEIKACVNLVRGADSVYRERENIVLSAELEPGSTLKIPAMMAALEDGKITVDQHIDCGRGEWRVDASQPLISDHNTGDKANGVIPVPQAIVRSSNVAMAKIIYNGYKENPQQYVNTLRRMGVCMPIDIPFKGAATPSLRGPEENPKWSKSDLTAMAYGYSINMPILYTLTFYNAIANNGKMMNPLFVKRIVRNGMVIEEFEPKVLKEKICSDKTLSLIQDMMLQVVEDPEHATGKPVKSDYVRIAGKTGTARYGYNYSKGSSSSVTGHRVSFCGFYPYKNPKYTCIVFIQNPKGNPGGGSMAGPVFKEIAERVMAKVSSLTVKSFVPDSFRTQQPPIAAGNKTDLESALKGLGFKYFEQEHLKWVSATIDSTNTVAFAAYKYKPNTVPNLKGMGLKDAIFLLERVGMRVRVQGRGKVYSQSARAGSQAWKGAVVEIKLK